MSLTIETTLSAEQTARNLARWEEILADKELARLPHRIETDRHGHILMSPPPAFAHADRQGQIVDLLKSLLPGGRALPECPLSTADGVKAIDVAWLMAERSELIDRPVALSRAPEICVEVLSPSNTTAEMNEKRMLYFDAGAKEVWICQENGRLEFYCQERPNTPAHSLLCPDFPTLIR
jgi:Uma2 family endonuclease